MIGDLTRATCAANYEALRTRVSERTRRSYSIDTHRAMLAEGRMLMKFAIGKRWLKVSPLEGLEGLGKRRHGKPQLRIDEARKWTATAIGLADNGDVGAVVALVALLLGMRASEIVSRVVRDLDDDNRQLWIPDSKTEAGKRTLRIPEVLRPYLERLAANRAADALIFGSHDRDWPRACVQRICSWRASRSSAPTACAGCTRRWPWTPGSPGRWSPPAWGTSTSARRRAATRRGRRWRAPSSGGR
jgi:integrase